MELSVFVQKGIEERPPPPPRYGVVLNKADLNLLGRFESHRRQYYDNRHYSRYYAD